MLFPALGQILRSFALALGRLQPPPPTPTPLLALPLLPLPPLPPTQCCLKLRFHLLAPYTGLTPQGLLLACTIMRRLVRKLPRACQAARTAV